MIHVSPAIEEPVRNKGASSGIKEHRQERRGEGMSEEMHGKIEAAGRGPLKRMSAHGFLRHAAEIDDGRDLIWD